MPWLRPAGSRTHDVLTKTPKKLNYRWQHVQRRLHDFFKTALKLLVTNRPKHDNESKTISILWLWNHILGHSISSKLAPFDSIPTVSYWLTGGMTNYRIDRIGTHRHASAPNLTTSTRQNRGRGIKVQFQGVNIGQTAGKVSKQASCI